MSRILRDIPIEKQLARHARWWEMQRAAWQQPQAARTVPQSKPVICISRQFGSGGSEIAREVATQLGYQFCDRELLEAIAARSHVREELVAQFDEHVRGALDTYLNNLFTGHIFDNTKYMHRLTQVVLGVAQYGSAVIVGRGANFIIAPERCLRVRIVAPLPERVAYVKDHYEHTREQALREIARYDREQRAFIDHHFHREIDDPLAHDLIINTAGVEPSTAQALIIALVARKLELQKLSPESMSQQPQGALR